MINMITQHTQYTHTNIQHFNTIIERINTTMDTFQLRSTIRSNDYISIESENEKL